MTAERNKKIIYQFFDNMNNKDWDALEKLIHNDFYGEGGTIEDLAHNPFFEFLKLLGLHEETISHWKKLISSFTDKQGILTERKFASDFLINWEIKDIIADEDRVWAERECIFKDPNQRNFKLSSFIIVRIKENQITEFNALGRYFNTLIQYGKIVIARNKEEEVQNYIQALKNMGIIPLQAIK